MIIRKLSVKMKNQTFDNSRIFDFEPLANDWKLTNVTSIYEINGDIKHTLHLK